MNISEVFDQLLNLGSFDGSILIRKFGKCVFFSEGEAIKLFRPQLKRGLSSQIIFGDFGFFLSKEQSIESETKSIIKPASLSTCSTFALIALVRSSAITDHGIDSNFERTLLKYLRIIPTEQSGITREIGEDFFRKEPLERAYSLAAWLKAL